MFIARRAEYNQMQGIINKVGFWIRVGTSLVVGASLHTLDLGEVQGLEEIESVVVHLSKEKGGLNKSKECHGIIVQPTAIPSDSYTSPKQLHLRRLTIDASIIHTNPSPPLSDVTPQYTQTGTHAHTITHLEAVLVQCADIGHEVHAALTLLSGS
jgi:hypothetical protein